jgi:hypothetical protein
VKFLYKLFFKLSFIILLTSNLNAQVATKTPKSDFWEHVRFGGGLGLSTTNDFFTLGVSPSAIYEFNPQVALGLSLNYTYNRLKNQYRSNIYGGSIIGLLHPIPEIQLSAELEQLRVNRTFEGSLRELGDDNYWSPALFVGAGYRTNNVTIGLRYDLLYRDNRSVYASALSPFVRVYF